MSCLRRLRSSGFSSKWDASRCELRSSAWISRTRASRTAARPTVRAVSSARYLKASAEDSGSLLNGVISFDTAAAFPPKVKSPWCKSLMRFSSALVTKVIAVPVCPARPVRPIRCKYDEALRGMSKFTTVLTCLKSIPRTTPKSRIIPSRTESLFFLFAFSSSSSSASSSSSSLFFFFFFFIFFLSGLSRKRLSKQSSVSSLGMAFGPSISLCASSATAIIWS